MFGNPSGGADVFQQLRGAGGLGPYLNDYRGIVPPIQLPGYQFPIGVKKGIAGVSRVTGVIGIGLDSYQAYRGFSVGGGGGIESGISHSASAVGTVASFYIPPLAIGVLGGNVISIVVDRSYKHGLDAANEETLRQVTQSAKLSANLLRSLNSDYQQNCRR